MVSYDKLTKPQQTFMQRLASGKPTAVWPGTDKRVAGGLERAGLISVASDLATLTDAGRAALAAARGESNA